MSEPEQVQECPEYIEDLFPPSDLVNARRYKFDEAKLLREIAQYIDATYNQHYSKTQFQAAEFIFDGGHGTGFLIGNIMKYAQRYGKKDGFNRKDLLKIAHYALMLLYVHDKYNTPPEPTDLPF